MPNDFKPLRRKIGVLTLMMACVSMGGWVRSRGTFDSIAFANVGKLHFVPLMSYEGRLLGRGPLPSDSIDYFPSPEILSYPSEDVAWQYDEEMDIKYLFRCFDCYVGTVTKGSDLGRIVWSLPYMIIVVPLTFLSAWMLLSKPRTKKSSGPTLVSDSP